MTSLRYDEQSLIALPGADVISSRRRSVRRYDELVRRLARLERLASDPESYENIVTTGRHLRLCAAIAWASDTVDEARLKVFAKKARALLH